MSNVYCWLGLTAVLVGAGPVMPAAHAGVRVELAESAGAGTNGASTSRRVLYFQGDRSRSEWRVTFTSPWAREQAKRAGRSDPSSVVIVDRVSDNREFSWDPEGKTYSESPLYSPSFVHLHVPVPAVSTRMAPPDDSLVHITAMKYEVEPTGERKLINGFPVRLYRFVIEEQGEDSKTGRIMRSRLIQDLWNSTDPRVMAAYRDYLDYNRALAKLYRTSVSADFVKQIPMMALPFTFGASHKPGAPDPLGKLPGFPVEISSKWVSNCLSRCAGHDVAETTPNMHIEIVAIQVGHFPASLFEVPEGYQKQ